MNNFNIYKLCERQTIKPEDWPESMLGLIMFECAKCMKSHKCGVRKAYTMAYMEKRAAREATNDELDKAFDTYREAKILHNELKTDELIEQRKFEEQKRTT